MQRCLDVYRIMVFTALIVLVYALWCVCCVCVFMWPEDAFAKLREWSNGIR